MRLPDIGANCTIAFGRIRQTYKVIDSGVDYAVIDRYLPRIVDPMADVPEYEYKEVEGRPIKILYNPDKYRWESHTGIGLDIVWNVLDEQKICVPDSGKKVTIKYE